jgi:hypothetical protein
VIRTCALPQPQTKLQLQICIAKTRLRMITTAAAAVMDACACNLLVQLARAYSLIATRALHSTSSCSTCKMAAFTFYLGRATLVLRAAPLKAVGAKALTPAMHDATTAAEAFIVQGEVSNAEVQVSHSLKGKSLCFCSACLHA